MAQTLVVGGGCPVCGSEHHPHPARRSAPARSTPRPSGAPARRSTTPKAGRLAHDEHVRDLTTRIALAELLAGTEPRPGLAERVAEADAEVARLQRARRSTEPQVAAGCAPWSRSRTSSPAAATRPASRSRAWSPPRRPQRVRARRDRRRDPGRALGHRATPTWPPAPTRLTALAPACDEATRRAASGRRTPTTRPRRAEQATDRRAAREAGFPDAAAGRGRPARPGRRSTGSRPAGPRPRGGAARRPPGLRRPRARRGGRQRPTGPRRAAVRRRHAPARGRRAARHARSASPRPAPTGSRGCTASSRGAPRVASGREPTST